MPTELIIVLVVGLLLLFSAKKLPDMARGLGQSMRVFKAETRGLREDEQTARSEASPGTPGDDTGIGGGPPPALGPGRSGAEVRPAAPGTPSKQARDPGAEPRGTGPADRRGA